MDAVGSDGAGGADGTRGLAARRAARDAWAAAGSFEDLCALGARFVAGDLAGFPGWGASWPDAETDRIADALARLNRGGLLTVASQPAFAGRRDGREALQRAFVAGFARGELCTRLAALDGPDVTVRVHGADAALGAGEDEPLTLEDGEARVLAGRSARDEELALFAEHVGADALRELATARYVVAWDPVWGRADALWSALVAAVEARGG